MSFVCYTMCRQTLIAGLQINVQVTAKDEATTARAYMGVRGHAVILVAAPKTS